MSTNYYLHQNNGDEPLHIGKSSGGWAFALHVMPDLGIRTLADWRRRWVMGGNEIADEYGRVVSPDRMLEIVTHRDSAHHSVVDGKHCVARGEGAWDCIAGEFC